MYVFALNAINITFNMNELLFKTKTKAFGLQLMWWTTLYSVRMLHPLKWPSHQLIKNQKWAKFVLIEALA